MFVVEKKSARYLEQLVPVPEAAALAGVSARTMHRLLDTGLIPFTRPSQHRRVRRGDVLDYLAQRTEHGVVEPEDHGFDYLAD